MQYFSRLLIALLFVVTAISAQARDLTHTRVSVLTCAPGEDLYSLFGHTALRVMDSANKSDIVYNWGTFQFDDPDFYLKFTRGKLLYMLSAETFADFMAEFWEEKRSVYEQELHLTPAEKMAILQAVQTNLLEQNRYYHYDFLFDNCTTRVRDIVSKYTGRLPGSVQLVPTGTTFRNMLYVYLDRGGQSWSKLGIDILLGSNIDKKVTNYQSMFLPDYLMKGLDSAGTGIVQQKTTTFYSAPPATENNKYTPLLLFSVIAAVIIALTLIKNPRVKFIARFIDALLFFVTGLLGILLLFMWFGTNHISCRNNYNLLWAMPFNVIAAVLVFKKPLWFKKYFYAIMFINLATLLLWPWLPQQLNIALIPLVLLIALRSYRLAKK